MYRRSIHTLILGAALAHGSASAQMQVEVRSGLTIGNHFESAAGLEPGSPSISFDAVIRQQVHPRFAVFGGYVRTAFGCEDKICAKVDDDDPGITVVGNHGVLGVEWGSGGPWLRAGAMLGTVKAGTLGDPPEMGLGFYGAAGLSVGSGRFRFLPSLSTRLRMQAKSASDDTVASAFSLDVGFAYQLSGGGG